MTSSQRGLVLPLRRFNRNGRKKTKDYGDYDKSLSGWAVYEALSFLSFSCFFAVYILIPIYT